MINNTTVSICLGHKWAANSTERILAIAPNAKTVNHCAEKCILCRFEREVHKNG